MGPDAQGRYLFRLMTPQAKAAGIVTDEIGDPVPAAGDSSVALEQTCPCQHIAAVAALRMFGPLFYLCGESRSG